jgi:hypothetical protein
MEDSRRFLLSMSFVNVYFISVFTCTLVLPTESHVNAVVFGESVPLFIVAEDGGGLCLALVVFEIWLLLYFAGGDEGQYHVLGVVFGDAAGLELAVDPDGQFFEAHSLCVVVVEHVGDDPCDFVSVVFLYEGDALVDDWVEDVVVLGVVALVAGQEGGDLQYGHS